MEKIKAPMCKEWYIEGDGMYYGATFIPFKNITSITLMNKATKLLNGVISMKTMDGKIYSLGIPFKQKELGEEAFAIIEKSYGDAQKREQDEIEDNAVYKLKGVRGRNMRVYEDKCVLKTEVTFGSLITGNATDGSKTIFYVDCNGVQFKESGATIGYIQLETASSLMNNKSSNVFNENTFTYDTTVLSNEDASKIHGYIMEQISKAKAPKVQTIVQGKSSAEELKELFELVQMGIMTQEEFDEKKKQILDI